MEIFDKPLTEIANAVRQKEIKSVDLVRGFLDRIEKVNGQLNAVVLSNAEHAIKLAEKADSQTNSTR